MKNAVWIVTVLVCYYAGQATSAHQRKYTRPKVVGGVPITINSVPFLLALHTRKGGFRCGAIILSASWGMSAQHCVTDPSAWSYYVRAGSSWNAFGGSVHRIAKFYYVNSTRSFPRLLLPDHDIVLFKVVSNFRFSRTVWPAKLPAEGQISPKLLQVSGWGVTDMDHSTSFIINAANVSKVEWEDCIRTTPFYPDLVKKDKHLCYGGGNADACYGDSGGPLADSDTVYGIVSFGADCGDVPGVYVDVSFYRQWIKQITNL